MQEIPKQTFWQRSNDLHCRGFAHRLTRFIRTRLRNLCQTGLLLAEDPRVVTAWKRGWDADHFVRLVRWRDRGFCPRVIYDIGAHAGKWSEMCHGIFSSEENILFEPQPELFARARSCQPSGSKWRVFPVALGHEEKTVIMHLTENEAASSILPPSGNGVPPDWGTRRVAQAEVRVETLDGLVAREGLPAPDLVKIDVQGYEGHVIAGGNNVLSKARALIVEVSLHTIYERQALLPEIIGALSDLKFEVEDLNETCREWAGRIWQVDLWLRRLE